MVHVNMTMLNLTNETKQIELINNHQKEVNKTNVLLLRGLIIYGNGKFSITYIRYIG